MKKGFIIVVALLLAISLHSPAKASHGVLAEYCALWEEGIATPSVNINTRSAYQLFTIEDEFPGEQYLSSVMLWAYPLMGDQAKVKIKIANMTAPSVAGVIAEKTAFLKKNSGEAATINMPEVPLPSGIYMLKIEPIHSSPQIIWQYKDSNCYAGGGAVIDNVYMQNRDFGFMVWGTHKNSTPAQQPSQPETDDPNQPDNGAPAAPEPTIPPPASDTIGSSNDSTTKKTVSNENTVPGNTEEAKPIIQKKEEEQKANPEPPKKFTDEEIAAFIAWVKEDYEKHRVKGIFGLGGELGRILSWRNIYIFFGVLVLIIILKIFRHLRKQTPQAPKI